MGCEKLACIFMNENIATWVCLCVRAYGHAVCFSQSPTTSSNHPEPPHVGCQKWQVLSAVRQSGDCRLGDHYKGHKRAIYRTASEWSQHGPPTLQHCTVLGHKRKSPKCRIRGQRGMWWLKHEGEGRGHSTGISLMIVESEAEERNEVAHDDSQNLRVCFT